MSQKRKIGTSKATNPFTKMSLANLQHFVSDHYLTSSEKIHQLYHAILDQMTDDNGVEMMLAASVVLSEYCEFLGSQWTCPQF